MTIDLDVDTFKLSVYEMMYSLFENDNDPINKSKDMTDRVVALLALSVRTPKNETK